MNVDEVRAEIEPSLQAARQIEVWIAAHRDMELLANFRNRLFGPLMDLTIEHFAAIVALCDLGHFGSALALARLAAESLTRGLYVDCVQDSRLPKLHKYPDDWPSQLKLLQTIEKRTGVVDGMMTGFHHREWRQMCSYTHGGQAQIRARFNVDTISANYESGELKSLLRFATTAGAAAYVAMCRRAGQADWASHVERIVEMAFPDEPAF